MGLFSYCKRYVNKESLPALQQTNFLFKHNLLLLINYSVKARNYIKNFLASTRAWNASSVSIR